MDNKINISRYRYMICQDLFVLMSEIRYAIIKGESLSLFAYGAFNKRTSADIDVLISRNDLKIVENILKNQGYKQPEHNRIDEVLALSYSHQIVPFNKTIGAIYVELDINFDLFWGEYEGKRVNISEFLSDTIEIEIYGCYVKTLPPFKTMIQLILHHYKEMNSIYHLCGHNCINYNMFKDVYYLWKNNQEAISLDKLYAISSEYGIIPYVFYILYFTNRIFNDANLEKYIETFKTSDGVALLDYYGLAENERKPWKVDFEIRLKTENMYELIKNDLTDADTEKLERNRRIFG